MAGESHGKRMERWARGGKPGSPPVPAATVVLVRGCADGVETLMLRRNSKLAFGGMWVFPGGRVEDADRTGLASDDEIGAARRAAVREAGEETGLVVEEDAMVVFSHWTPPVVTPRRFFTWFFLAEAPAGEVTIDCGEIHEHDWMRPAEALRRRDAGEIELAPPTWVTLHELSRSADVVATLAAARKRAPERYLTRVAVCDEGPVAIWHGDAGYEAADATAAGPRHRLLMADAGWRFERTDR